MVDVELSLSIMSSAEIDNAIIGLEDAIAEMERWGIETYEMYYVRNMLSLELDKRVEDD